jgi:hypothetical protein
LLAIIPALQSNSQISHQPINYLPQIISKESLLLPLFPGRVLQEVIVRLKHDKIQNLGAQINFPPTNTAKLMDATQRINTDLTAVINFLEHLWR